MTKLDRIAKILDGMAEREETAFQEAFESGEDGEANEHAWAKCAYERAALVVRSFIDED